MATKRLVRKQHDPLIDDAKQYALLKTSAAEIAGRVKDLRDRLIERVEKTGYDTEGGHQLLDLPDEVAGLVGFKRFKRERRVSQSFKTDELLEFLEDKGLYDEAVVMVPQVDGDALARLVFEGKISEAELNSYVDEKVTYALTMQKD